MEVRFDLMTFSSDTMLKHHFSQNLKLIERDKFNHLIITLTLTLTCELKLSFNK
jgi:hypothetical protein